MKGLLKRAISLVLIFSLLLTFSSCGDDDKPTTEDQPQVIESQQEKPVVEESEQEETEEKDDEKYIDAEKSYPKFEMFEVGGAYSYSVIFYQYNEEKGFYTTTYEKLDLADPVKTNEGFMEIVKKFTPPGTDPVYPLITLEGGTATVDWPSSITQLSGMSDLLASVAMTIEENHMNVTKTTTLIDGENGFILPALWFDPQKQNTLVAERALFKAPADLSGTLGYMAYFQQAEQMIVPYPEEFRLDDTQRKVGEFIYMLPTVKKTVNKPQELMDDVAYEELITTAYGLYAAPAGADMATPLLKEAFPLGYGVPLEAVNQLQRYLFGEVDYETVEPHSISLWFYHPEYQVFLPPHMGGGMKITPVVLSYTDAGNAVMARVVYMSTDLYFGEIPAGKTISDLVYNDLKNAPQYEFQLTKTANGGYEFVSARAV